MENHFNNHLHHTYRVCTLSRGCSKNQRSGWRPLHLKHIWVWNPDREKWVGLQHRVEVGQTISPCTQKQVPADNVRHMSRQSHYWVTCKIIDYFCNHHLSGLWVELSPVERGAVDGVDGAVARSEWEGCRSSQCHTLALGGRSSWCLWREGASKKESALRAHQEGVRVPGRKSQRSDTYSAAASCLQATHNSVSQIHINSKQVLKVTK